MKYVNKKTAATAAAMEPITGPRVRLGLAGWGGRIRTSASQNQNSRRLSARGGSTRTCASRLKSCRLRLSITSPVSVSRTSLSGVKWTRRSGASKRPRRFEMSQEQRFSLYVTLSRISRGRALTDLGRLGEARGKIELGIDEARRSSPTLTVSLLSYSGQAPERGQ
jgi:hypothetical protein